MNGVQLVEYSESDIDINLESSSEQNETKFDDFDELNQSIAQELIFSPAITDVRLAQKFNISRQTANRRRRSEGVQKILAETLSIKEKNLREVFGRSILKLVELMNHSEPAIALGAAKQISSLGKDFFYNIAREESDRPGLIIGNLF